MKKGLIVAGAAVLAVYLAGLFAFAGRYPFGSSAGGRGIGLMTPSEAALSLSNATASERVWFVGKDGRKESLSYGDLGITRPAERRLASDGTPSAFLWPVRLVAPVSYELDMSLSYEEGKLLDGLGKLSAVRLGTTMPKDSEVVKLADGSYGITAEVEGNAVDMDRLAAAVRRVLDGGGDMVDLAAEDCYLKPGLARTDSGLLALVGEMSAPSNLKITLDAGGGASEVLDPALVEACFTVEGNQAAIDPAGIEAAVEYLAGKYDTYGTTRQFLTSTGETVSVSPRTEEIGPCDFGGWLMDRDGMRDALTEALSARQDASVEIPWTYRGGTRGELNDFGTTYLEISLRDQHMWLYSEGELLVDTDVVTGSLAMEDCATPPGIYKTTDFYTEWTMRGSYGTAFCHYFIRLTLDGVGVHDSNRSAFGGDIYKTNGSHGCINTPYGKVKPIFEFLHDRQYTGEMRHTPVIVWA